MHRTLRSIPFALAASVVALSSAPAPAHATDGFASGSDLKGWCDNMEMDDIHWGLCVGSITAAHDVVMTYQNAGVGGQAVCTLISTSRNDVIQAVVEYMEQHPDELEYSLGDVVLSAMVEKFPCDITE